VTKFFRSAFLPLVVIVVLLYLLDSSSLPDALGAVLPFVLIAAFWIFFLAQRKRRVSDTAGVRHDLQTGDTPLPESQSAKDLAERIGLGG